MKEKLKKLYHWSNTWTGTVVIVLLVIFFLAQAFIIPSGSMKKTLLPGDALFAKKFAYGVPIPHIPWIEIPILPDFRGDGHLIDGPRPKDGDIVIFRYPLDIKKHFVKRCFAGNGDEVIYDDKGFWLHPKEGDEYVKKHFKGFVIEKRLGKLFVLNPYMKEHKGIQYINQNVTFFPLKDRAKQLIEFAGLNNYTGFVPYDEIKKIIHRIIGAFALQGINANPQDVDIGMGVYLENGKVKYFYSKLKKDQFLMIGDNRDESFDSRFWGPVPYKLVVGKPWFIYMSWDSDFTIRWNRVGKTISEIEEELREGKRPYITAGCEEK
jgi:signal peptidase I